MGRSLADLNMLRGDPKHNFALIKDTSHTHKKKQNINTLGSGD